MPRHLRDVLEGYEGKREGGARESKMKVIWASYDPFICDIYQEFTEKNILLREKCEIKVGRLLCPLDLWQETRHFVGSKRHGRIHSQLLRLGLVILDLSGHLQAGKSAGGTWCQPRYCGCREPTMVILVTI